MPLSKLAMKMEHGALLFAMVAAVCYLLAILTSHAFVHWVVPKKLRAGLGSGSRNVSIDGVRGYLAFSVYIHHCLLTWIYMREGHLGPLPHNFENQLGATSVAVFFMITAFLFWGRVQAKGNLQVRSFFISRLFRIYPLYIFALFLICVGVAYTSNWTLVESPASITAEVAKWLGFRSPDINHYRATQINPATWTLLYEAWFYLCLPLLVGIVCKKYSMRSTALAVGIIFLLFKLNHLQINIASAFLGGILAVYWGMDKKRVALAQTRTAALVALLCLGCVVAFMYGPFTPLGIALLSVFFTVIASGNTLFGFLTMRSGLWLGEISYSIYLLHAIVLWVVMENILPRVPVYHFATQWFVISAISITPILVVISSASYLLIERPLIDIGHRLLRPRASLATAELNQVAPAA